MSYSTPKGRTLGTFLIFFFCLLLLGGCDRIPFLANLFPSAKTTAKSESAPATEQPEIRGNVLARVDNWVLTLEDFNQKVDALQKLPANLRVKVETFDQKKNLLDSLVRQQLLVKEAKARGLDKKKEFLDAIRDYSDGLLVNSLLTQLTEDIKVESKEIEDYYNQNKEMIKEPAQWHLREIVVPTPSQANDILIELLKGADFGSMATQYSKADNAKNGGDMGLIDAAKFSQLSPQLQTAIISLEVGGLTNVVKGSDGFYIIKLEEKKGGKEKQLSEVWNDINDYLTMVKQNQRIQDLLSKLKQNAGTSIQSHEDLLR
jgi:peptidyl-prolyl cis-trans isomerase C